MKDALHSLRALAGRPWLALDTETTGLGRWDEVIEVAVVDAGGAVVFESLVRPGRPITARTTALHGLTSDHVAEAPPWPRVWPDLAKMLADRPVLAWNAAFDLRLLRQSCARYGLPMRPPRFLCLREAFRCLHPVVRASLDAACLALSVPERPAHRARADAEVARLVALALIGSPGDAHTDPAIAKDSQLG